MNQKRHHTNQRQGRSSRSTYKGVCVRADFRLAVYLRDSFRCLYCLIDLHGAAPMDVTLDHLLPTAVVVAMRPRTLSLLVARATAVAAMLPSPALPKNKLSSTFAAIALAPSSATALSPRLLSLVTPKTLAREIRCE